MSSPADVKTIPVFTQTSIRAMSPMAQHVAELLVRAGWIQIVDESGKGGDSG